MKEKILNVFKNLGFEMESLENLGYGFEYEGIHYLWMNSNDEEFFSIAVPNVLDKEDVTELEFYQIMDKMNSSLKYVKAYGIGDNVWLFYERNLLGNDEFEELIPRVIINLENAVRLIQGDLDETEASTDDIAEASTDENK